MEVRGPKEEDGDEVEEDVVEEVEEEKDVAEEAEEGKDVVAEVDSNIERESG
jgi:hypothetical protein